MHSNRQSQLARRASFGYRHGGLAWLTTLLTITLPLSYADQSPAQQPKLVKVHDSIYRGPGNGNTYIVVTPEGNVIVDTGLLPEHAALFKSSLRAINSGPIKYIILTHGHEDHRGGVSVWKEPTTQVIAQRNYAEFCSYQSRLAPFFARRSAAQFRGKVDETIRPGYYEKPLDATVLFDDKYEFELGGMRFELHHAPGETYDHLSVWIPQLKIAFTGDNYSAKFPALYTLRGTKPRWALDYIDSLDKVLGWKPDLLLPGHGEPLIGNGQIADAVTKLRDAICYVHDETVRGMNEGKGVFQLMREIKLPPAIQIDEGYGTVAWSVRGIYEGYAGWFDGNPVNMYATPTSAVYPTIVEMSGGPDAVADRADKMIKMGQFVEALHLAEIVLEAAPQNSAGLRVRLAALEALAENSKNSMERGWLRYGIQMTKKRLAAEAASLKVINRADLEKRLK